MVNQVQTSDPIDPLLSCSSVSLFPRTFRVPDDASKTKEDDSLHDFLKSMDLRSPHKLLEQAKTILASTSEPENPIAFAIPLQTEDRSEVIVKGGDNPQERRPALGRKKPRFSFKPNSSQPALNLEPSINVDQLDDPEQYFVAHEKLETANKEILRQKVGILTELKHYNPSTAAQRRRPGTLGKSVSYKHRFSLSASQNDDGNLSSQERFEQDTLSPSENNANPETPAPKNALPDNELAGSIGQAENRINNVLDDLLSTSCEDLDGDGALNLLQERFQLKTFDIGKLTLPDWPDIGWGNSKASEEALKKPRLALADIRNVFKGRYLTTSLEDRHVGESSVLSSASPTPTKSPFSSIALLRKRISQSSPSNDPFSSHDLGLLPVRNISHDDSWKETSVSGTAKLLLTEGDSGQGASKGSHEVGQGSTHSLDTCMNDNNVNRDIDGAVEDYSFTMDTNAEVELNEPIKLDRVEDKLQEAVASVPSDPFVEDSTGEQLSPSLNNIDPSSPAVVEHDGPSETQDAQQDNQQKSQEPVVDEQTKEKEPPRRGRKRKDSSNQKLADPSSPAVVQQDVVEGTSNTQDSNQHSREHGMTEGSQADIPPRKGHRRNEVSRRHSLAGAGMLWESGVRKSTRIKSRPLQHWKGERFLFARIHSSLPTVIGVKCISPTSDGKRDMKVKSFVDEKYKDLVDSTALH